MTEEDGVPKTGRAALGPMLDVVGVEIRAVNAPGEATTAVAEAKGTDERGGRGPPLSTEIQNVCGGPREIARVVAGNGSLGDDEAAIAAAAQHGLPIQRSAIVKLGPPRVHGGRRGTLLHGHGKLSEASGPPVIQALTELVARR